MNELDFDTMSRETLVKLLRLNSRLFLALDGFWFLAAKEKLGYEAALELLAVAWEGYNPYEANKVRQAMQISGTDATGIVDSLKYSALVPCMRHEITEASENRAVFALYDCPTLLAQERAGYAPTCDSIGLRCFAAYVRAVNPRAAVRFIDGPPRNSQSDVSCKWEITIDEEHVD